MPTRNDSHLYYFVALPMALLLGLVSMSTAVGCAALQSPAAKTAYDTVLPYAKDAITRYFEGKGEQPVIESGGCFAEPIVVEDEDGLTWFLCAATGTPP